MDKEFLNKRLKAIGSYQYGRIKSQKERVYYISYFKKLTSELKLRGKDLRTCLGCINSFFTREKLVMESSLFFRQKSVLELACKNARDVVVSMQRWEGIDNSSHYMEQY